MLVGLIIPLAIGLFPRMRCPILDMRGCWRFHID